MSVAAGICVFILSFAVFQAEFFIRFMLSISAQAIFRSGTRTPFRLPCREYSIRLLFFPAPLWSFVNCTFIITAPSFKCRLTFFPTYDLALLALKLSITIPLLGRRFCSSIVGKWAGFHLSLVYRVWCFRFCRYLSRDFYNVPFFCLKNPCLTFFAFKAL